MAVIDPSGMLGQAYEPIQKNRFRVLIDEVPTFMIKAVKLPNITNNKVELHHLNQIRKVKGKTTYGDASFTMYQPIAPNGMQIIMNWLRLHHEAVTGRDGYNDFYKKDIIVQMLGPIGDIVSEWVLKGAFIIDYNAGDLDYEADGQVNAELQLSVDWMELNF